MFIALRSWLLVSVAAGLTACASNPPLQPVSIVYRGDAPGRAQAPSAPQPVIMSDLSRDTSPAPGADRLSPPPARVEEPAPYQLVADLGPSTGTPAVAEARSIAPESGLRPGGARRLPQDNPAARAVEVLPRDTLYDISRRYSVNMRALIETNGLEPPYALKVGGVIHLPPPNVHVVERGETLYSVSRRYNVDTRSLALLNGMARPWTVWPGDELLLPPLARDTARAQAVPVAAVAPPPVTPQISKSISPAPVATPPAASTGPIALVSKGPSDPPPAEPKVIPAPPPLPQPVVTAPVKSTPPPTVGGDFIWPVSGKVLKGFGAGADGQRNDGINISGAKGTDIRASAGGEVVYAGSELAGFGNLVLIRHPGGWVTAYAHSDTVLVSEGDLVKQGQAIATVGSTGNAGSPQVHFELRKGKEPVDPTRHLPALQG